MRLAVALLTLLLPAAAGAACRYGGPGPCETVVVSPFCGLPGQGAAVTQHAYEGTVRIDAEGLGSYIGDLSPTSGDVRDPFWVRSAPPNDAWRPNGDNLTFERADKRDCTCLGDDRCPGDHDTSRVSLAMFAAFPLSGLPLFEPTHAYVGKVIVDVGEGATALVFGTGNCDCAFHAGSFTVYVEQVDLGPTTTTTTPTSSTTTTVPASEPGQPCDAWLYWTDAATHTIERTDLCGSRRTTLWSGPLATRECEQPTQQPSRLAADQAGGWLFWLDEGCGDLWRGPLDGSGAPEPIVHLDGGRSAADLVWDTANGLLWWSEIAGPGLERSGQLQRFRHANADGTDVVTVGGNVPFSSMVLDPSRGRIFLLDPFPAPEGGRVISVPLLTAPGALAALRTGIDTIVQQGLLPAAGLAWDPVDDMFYFTEATERFASPPEAGIGRVRTDGTGRTRIATFPGSPGRIALDVAARTVYAVERDVDRARITRRNLDGSGRVVVGCGDTPDPGWLVLVGTGAGCHCCGDGLPACFGEACDAGPAGDACCTAQCTAVERGTPCENRPCTDDVCDGAGACTHEVAADAGCLAAGPGSGLRVARGRGGGRRLAWNWTGPAEVPSSDFGNPVEGAGQSLCVIDAADGAPRLAATVPLPAGASWRATRTGFRYDDGTTAVRLRGGAAGRARIAARTGDLPRELKLQRPVTLRLERDDSAICFESRQPARRRAAAVSPTTPAR